MTEPQVAAVIFLVAALVILALSLGGTLIAAEMWRPFRQRPGRRRRGRPAGARAGSTREEKKKKKKEEASSDPYDAPERSWTMVHAVEAPVDRQLAWDFWTAVDNWARVDDDIEAVRLDGDGGFRPGATGTTVTGSDVIHWTVAEVVEPRSAHIRFAAGDATLESRWTFEVVSPASCRVSQEVVLHGPGAQAVRDQVARGMGEGIPAGMSALVDAMVASSQTLPSNAR